MGRQHRVTSSMAWEAGNESLDEDEEDMIDAVEDDGSGEGGTKPLSISNLDIGAEASADTGKHTI